MTNKEIENKIKNACSNMVPDVLDSVLSGCEEQKGKVIVLTNNRKTNPWIKRISGIAAAVVLILGGVIGGRAYQSNHAVDSTVSLDVNPSIEIQVNQKEHVLEVKPLNEEGYVVVGNMDFKGSSLDVTVNAIIGSMLRNGYLSDIQNSILVSVDNNDPEKGAQLQAKLTDEINMLFKSETFSGAVLSQTIYKDDQLQQIADEYGITIGKAQLIQQIVNQNTRYTFADLVPLSINELNLISESGSIKLENINSTGIASDKGYIGGAKAKEMAISHAGVKETEIRNYQYEMDYENGVLVYEIEFDCNGYEYDYDINALTGSVVKYSKDRDDDYVSSGNTSGNSNSGGNAGSSGGTTSGGNNSYIGETKAKEVALSHAGVSSSSLTSMKCEFDYDDGVALYEIEFKCNGYEYDYDINASTGSVVKHSKEYDDDYVSTSSGGHTSNSNSGGSTSVGGGSASSSTSYIGESSAKSIALSHAGVSSSNVTFMKCELDSDDGQKVYEIEFKSGGYEYDYEINATSGSILSSSKEVDD